jgi:flagellar protein FlgJ
VQAFIARLSELAQKAARSSGVPAELILAQAALETDWGRRTITTAGGADSHNLFGIKAGGQWQGPTTQVMTTEYTDAEAQKQLEAFRVYPSDEAAFNDYALDAQPPRLRRRAHRQRCAPGRRRAATGRLCHRPALPRS